MRGHIGVSLRAECAFGSVDVVSTVDGLVATFVVREAHVQKRAGIRHCGLVVT